MTHNAHRRGQCAHIVTVPQTTVAGSTVLAAGDLLVLPSSGCDGELLEAYVELALCLQDERSSAMQAPVSA
jgi:hypothetical protein